MNHFKGRGVADRMLIMGNSSPKIRLVWRHGELKKVQQKMAHDPEYRKRKQFTKIFSYGCEVT